MMRHDEKRGWSVGVVIPACNEEETIGLCVQAVRFALDRCATLRHRWITVVADSCTDRTVSRARQALGPAGNVIECSMRSPGTARRLGVAFQMERFATLDPATVWLATTDADSRVPQDWISTQLGLACASSDAVAGIVRAAADNGMSADQLAQLLSEYELYADGSHPHVHGANLGVRADAYLDVGGWSDKPLAEDHCLWERLKQRGWRVTSSQEVWVETSARLIGRACGGFADTLRLKFESLYG